MQQQTLSSTRLVVLVKQVKRPHADVSSVRCACGTANLSSTRPFVLVKQVKRLHADVSSVRCAYGIATLSSTRPPTSPGP